MKKRFPKLKSDRAAEKLLSADLSSLINQDNFTTTTFEFAPKDCTISLRVSESLLSAVKASSKRRGISYQKFIRQALEDALRKKAA